MVLAAFIGRGHYARHLRRMQAAYAERLEALRRAIDRSGAPLRLRPVQSGMHAVVDVEGVSAERVHAAAAARGVESMPLSAYYFGAGPRANALLLGFGSVTPAAIRAGVTKLARAVEPRRSDERCSSGHFARTIAAPATSSASIVKSAKSKPGPTVQPTSA